MSACVHARSCMCVCWCDCVHVNSTSSRCVSDEAETQRGGGREGTHWKQRWPGWWWPRWTPRTRRGPSSCNSGLHEASVSCCSPAGLYKQTCDMSKHSKTGSRHHFLPALLLKHAFKSTGDYWYNYNWQGTFCWGTFDAMVVQLCMLECRIFAWKASYSRGFRILQISGYKKRLQNILIS